MHPGVCVEEGGGANMWCGLDQRWKDTIIYAQWHTGESPRAILRAACQRLSLKSEEKRRYFRTYALFSRMHRLARLKPRAPEFDSFIYHWRSTRSPQSDNVTIHRCSPCDLCGRGRGRFTCPLWHTQPIPVTWPVRLGPALTLLRSRSDGEPLPLRYTPLRTGGAGEAEHAPSLPTNISHVLSEVWWGRKKDAIKNSPNRDNNSKPHDSFAFHFLSTVGCSIKLGPLIYLKKNWDFIHLAFSDALQKDHLIV